MVSPRPSEGSSPSPTVIHLPTLYSTWGAWLKGARTSANATQQQVEETSLPYFRARHVSVINWRMYSSMERDERVPFFAELEPLYRTFVEGYLLSFSALERDLYLRLARERIEAKRRKRERVQPSDWDRLARTLADIDGSKHDHLYLLGFSGQKDADVSEEKDSRRLKALADALRTDTSHLLEREAWVQQMLMYPTMTPQKKLVTIQGHMGTGKSHALVLLTQRLALQPDLYLIPYRFEAAESKTPDDHLAVFLSTILTDLTMPITDEAKQRPLEERIDQVLAAIRARSEQGQKVILLLDDAQEIFPSALEWSPAWEQFFETLVREPHSATVYMMTRTWPGWMDRRRTYLEETDLPELSQGAGIAIWQRFGFTDVPEDLLWQVVTRWGCNPQLIEMRAAHLKQRPWSFAWDKGGQVKVRSAPENENTTRLKNLLEQDSIFNPRTDIEARKMLQHVISSRLSHPARRILECLAASPLGLPLALLDEEFPHADEAFDELIRASLVDLSMAAANRAALVPLVREAQVHALASEGRLEGIEARVTDLYAHWLSTLQDFRDDAEKAALIAEMVVRYIHSRHLLKAAELFIGYGWLCILFGHIARIQRVFEAMVKENRGKIEDTRTEVGKLILQHRIIANSGKEVDRDERDRIYCDIHEKVIAGEVDLQPFTELEVLHNMLLYYNRSDQHTKFTALFEQTLNRLRSKQATPEIYAAFLADQALAMIYQADKCDLEEAVLRYTQASIDLTRESISNWRECLKNALPLQEQYILYKLARALNDLACDLRTMKQFAPAEEAIKESILLKKRSGTLPRSIAIAISEYSQILAAQGRIQDALSLSNEARDMLQQIVDNGGDAYRPELGLVLKEQADILCLQARLPEARTLLQQAIELIGKKPLRQKDKKIAIARVKEIDQILSVPNPYKLDQRWFSRFFDLIGYSDITMLTQAGPFTEEEEEEWQQLCAQEETDEVRERLATIMAESRKREFERTLGSEYAPMLYYPRINVEDIHKRINGLIELWQDIDVQETNAVVRRLYLDAVDEHLAFLKLCIGTATHDQQIVTEYNSKLFGKISEREFKIALQQLGKMLSSSRGHHLADPIIDEILEQLKSWRIPLRAIMDEHLFVPGFGPIKQAKNDDLLTRDKKKFSTRTICRFFQDVLGQYGEDGWIVEVSPARDNTSVDPNTRELIFPETFFTVRKVRQLLAEEIESHTYRAIAGSHSPLALLSVGLAGNIATDEGLAYHYVQRVSCEIYGQGEEKKWYGTLAIGLASGVLSQPRSFQEVRSFFEKMFLIIDLVDTDDLDGSLSSARRKAWSRCCRTFRGVPNLDQSGCYYSKDRAYLQGHLEVSDYLTHSDEQRLYVGCIGVHHLQDLTELNILIPNTPRLHLALDPDLSNHLATYER